MYIYIYTHNYMYFFTTLYTVSLYNYNETVYRGCKEVVVIRVSCPAGVIVHVNSLPGTCTAMSMKVAVNKNSFGEEVSS